MAFQDGVDTLDRRVIVAGQVSLDNQERVVILVSQGILVYLDTQVGLASAVQVGGAGGLDGVAKVE